MAQYIAISEFNPVFIFEEVRKLHTMICRVKDRDDFPVLLVGNKADLENERHLSEAALWSPIRHVAWGSPRSIR
ncbi:hypothetical protein ANCCEY_07537 [Ancylostoma ceylanicum]|uniref:Ras family protein n=1 Tax=Ancylostoma ceylanicum TaxID=53326 RepID=A0A0D6M0G1_9BILA|nr:hypothetical protein ANCCEY_07537 [Ancylostoma ceylanicum]